MTRFVGTRTVADIVSTTPCFSKVFEQFGIDYCCHGKQPLAAACMAAQVDLATVQAALDQVAGAAELDTADWTLAPLANLISDILATHHDYLRTALPRLSGMLAKVQRVHGAAHPELTEVARVFGQLDAELTTHMMKEERVLFPAIVQLERHGQTHPRGAWLIHPIGMMEHEHAAVGEMLAALKRTTGGYIPPPGACNTFRALYDGLAQLEADLHLHIHKENNILFPRAAALELEVLGAARPAGV
ncbi:MAG: iron-sulfur cluster repair di-iron protein [Planctomycetota bacterium]